MNFMKKPTILLNSRQSSHISHLRKAWVSTSSPVHDKSKAISSTNESKPAATNPWVRTKDPNGSELYYYWNPLTNETTSLGIPKPHHWVEVRDQNSSLSYWWNVDTNETTPLGAPRPSPIPYANPYPPLHQTRQPTMVGSMGSYFLIGISMTLGMLMVRAFLG